jgi:hypothetical protein
MLVSSLPHRADGSSHSSHCKGLRELAHHFRRNGSRCQQASPLMQAIVPSRGVGETSHESLCLDMYSGVCNSLSWSYVLLIEHTVARPQHSRQHPFLAWPFVLAFVATMTAGSLLGYTCFCSFLLRPGLFYTVHMHTTSVYTAI